MEISELEKGDRILFNDRTTPLKVEEVGEEEVAVSGPKGGKYEIYRDDETLLVCRKGNRRYSSYCRDLRKVGEWIRKGDTWTHSMTGAEIRVEEDDNGFYRVKSDFNDPDNPRYGFSQKEFAVEEAERIVDSNPAGEE